MLTSTNCHPVTHVAIVLDKSGSMSVTKKQTIEGFNEHVQQMKENGKNQEIRFSLITFNGEVFENLWDEPVENLQEVTEKDYDPMGSTAMRDAVGYTIKKLMETTDCNDPNTAYLVIIISDGEENSSTHYSVPALKEMIDACQKTGKWTFTYMGCSETYLKDISQQTNIPISNMAVWLNSDSKNAKFGFTKQREKLSKYYGARQDGVIRCKNVFSDSPECIASFVDQPPYNF